MQTAQNIKSELEIRQLELTPAEITKVCKLLRTVWPKAEQITEDYLRWLYLQNPVGHAVGFNAIDNNEVVGHYVTLPISAQVLGQTEKGLLSLNSAVHPDYQGRNLFKTLAAKTYELGSERGCNFVVGVANQFSTLLFKRQLKFDVVSPLEAKLGVGRIALSVETETKSDFERFWDKELLSWRFSRPDKVYRLTNSELGTNGKTVLTTTDKFGISANIATLPASLLPQLPRHSALGTPLRLWIGLDSRCNWKRSLYFDIPQRLRPSPLNLIFKDLTTQNRKLDKDRIRFSLLDFDVY